MQATDLNRLFIVEQLESSRFCSQPLDATTVFLDIRGKVLSAANERGLLGLAFHPQYSGNGRFFVFLHAHGDGALVISEYQASPFSSNTAGTD